MPFCHLQRPLESFGRIMPCGTLDAFREEREVFNSLFSCILFLPCFFFAIFWWHRSDARSDSEVEPGTVTLPVLSESTS